MIAVSLPQLTHGLTGVCYGAVIASLLFASTLLLFPRPLIQCRWINVCLGCRCRKSHYPPAHLPLFCPAPHVQLGGGLRIPDVHACLYIPCPSSSLCTPLCSPSLCHLPPPQQKQALWAPPLFIVCAPTSPHMAHIRSLSKHPGTPAEWVRYRNTKFEYAFEDVALATWDQAEVGGSLAAVCFHSRHTSIAHPGSSRVGSDANGTCDRSFLSEKRSYDCPSLESWAALALSPSARLTHCGMLLGYLRRTWRPFGEFP